MMKNILALFILLFAQFALADKPISFSGRVMDTSNNAIEDVSTKFNIKISNSLSCVIYDEDFTLDMTGTNGYFKVALGGGQLNFGPAGLDIFRSKGYQCKDGSSWSAGVNDQRKVTMTVKVGDQPAVTFASDTINGVAYANETDYIKGKAVTDLIQTSVSTTQVNVDKITFKTQDILDLVNGTNNVYAKQTLVESALNSKQNALTYTPLSPNRNLDDLANVATARTNLGLGSLAVRSTISDTDIPSLSWGKITGFPSGNFAAAAHVHAISDITNLSTTLSGKVDKDSFSCSNTQVVRFNSVSGFFCDEIHLSGDVIGTAGGSVVTKIQGKSVSTAAPQTGDSLVYNGTSWTPQAVAGGAGSTGHSFAGEIFMFPAACPTGSVLADGQPYDTSLYAELYQAYSCTFGCPSQITFKIPDYRGYYLRMAGTLDGVTHTISSATVAAESDSIKSHVHPITDPGHFHSITDPGHTHRQLQTTAVGSALQQGSAAYNGSNAYVNGLNTDLAYTGITQTQVKSTGITGTGAATDAGTETRPKTMVVNYCIRLHNN